MGEVQAGTTLGPDDLRVAFSTNTEPLSLPDIEQGQDVFALEVTGESMVSDNILPQDLIVVEKVGIDQIKIGDLIVTRYLKVKFNKLSKAEIDDILSNADNYDGPTLKYLIKKEDGVGYVLAPKNRDLRYTIETRQIKVDEIGRVVAVHRTIRRL
jgi:SOS-response transcriptional repressor LexA